MAKGFPPITKVISEGSVEFDLLGKWSNGRAVNHTLMYVVAGPGGQNADEFNQQAIRIASAWQDNLVSGTTDNYTFLGVNWMQMSESGMVGTVPPTSGKPSVGTGAGQVAPPNVAVLVSKLVTSRARDERNGRMFLIPPAEISVDENGILSPSDVTNLQGKMTAFFNATVDPGPVNEETDWHLAVGAWSQADKPALEVGGLWHGRTNQVSGFRVENLVATQRRRLRG